MRARADEKGLGFHVAYGAGAEGVFQGDSVRLRQVISNLAANAIKFTQVGEVMITVNVEDGGDAPSMVVIAVADTGIGFDDEARERLFARFVQADDSISRRFGGTGLGLSICKSLVELMGGDIVARSEPGVGSIFTVRLPLPRAAGFATSLSGSDAGEGLDLAGLRVLLAEDHPTNQRVVQLILAPLGVDLTIVADGAQAIDAFEGGVFDLILMDMQMPVMDGLAATREIRRLESEAGRPATPIAMLTANAMAEHRQVAADAGADSHIAKPVTLESLIGGMVVALAAGGQSTAGDLLESAAG
jgi:CheY-like chemotaxis protein